MELGLVFIFVVAPFLLLVGFNVEDCKGPKTDLDREAERHAYLETFYDF